MEAAEGAGGSKGWRGRCTRRQQGRWYQQGSLQGQCVSCSREFSCVSPPGLRAPSFTL